MGYKDDDHEAHPVCEFCGKRCNPTNKRLTVQYVSGWAKARTSGGTNALMLKKDHDRWAHLECVQKVSNGVHPDQQVIW